MQLHEEYAANRHTGGIHDGPQPEDVAVDNPNDREVTSHTDGPTEPYVFARLGVFWAIWEQRTHRLVGAAHNENDAEMITSALNAWDAEQ
jgi:hypothetical protein